MSSVQHISSSSWATICPSSTQAWKRISEKIGSIAVVALGLLTVTAAAYLCAHAIKADKTILLLPSVLLATVGLGFVVLPTLSESKEKKIQQVQQA
jgi:hypothetical protein